MHVIIWEWTNFVEQTDTKTVYTHLKSQQNHFLAKISVFWAKNAKIFKNKKLIQKKVRKHSIDTCI